MVKRYSPIVKFEQYSDLPEGDMELDTRGGYVKLSAYESLERDFLRLKYGKTCFRLAKLLNISHDQLQEFAHIHMKECESRGYNCSIVINGKEISFRKMVLIAEGK